MIGKHLETERMNCAKIKAICVSQIVLTFTCIKKYKFLNLYLELCGNRAHPMIAGCIWKLVSLSGDSVRIFDDVNSLGDLCLP